MRQVWTRSAQKDTNFARLSPTYHEIYEVQMLIPLGSGGHLGSGNMEDATGEL
jgi:hypothetical protein